MGVWPAVSVWFPGRSAWEQSVEGHLGLSHVGWGGWETLWATAGRAGRTRAGPGRSLLSCSEAPVKGVSVPWAAVMTCHKLGDLNNRNLLSHRLEARGLKVRLGRARPLPLAVGPQQSRAPRLRLHGAASPLCLCVSVFSCSKDAHCVALGWPQGSMTSF